MPLSTLLAQVRALVPIMRARAPALDAQAAFPTDDIAALREAGVLQAVLPAEAGGEGLGTQPTGADGLLALLSLLGQGNLALGRLVEAHVNALRLIVRCGDDMTRHRAAQDVREGHLLGLWVTDPPEGGLHLTSDGALDGGKQFCSGAGHVTRAVVTAEDGVGQTRLAYTSLAEGVVASPLPGGLAGMRAAATGQVRFHNAPATPFGAPGDYLREPDFSCGAWRTSAVTLGGLQALVEELRRQLVARGRQDDPHQQARVGETLIAVETARLWMAAAAAQAESMDAGADAITYVGLARLAVERACLDTMELAQRSLGVAALLRSNPVERLCRDLATYLRQPAADMVLTEAAAAAMRA